MITLISHFFNEEFLMPFWLQHHVPMFDHGIMIDYASTDRSVEIIRAMAPTWEIRPSRNEFFDYIEIDKEVMDIEKEITGWKTCLNTTEFLVHPNIKNYVNSLPAETLGIRTTGAIMVDKQHQRNTPLTEELLVTQKHFGYFEKKGPRPSYISRSRLIHKADNGQYTYGRHQSHIPALTADDVYCAWYGWSPMDWVKQRKLQIKTKIPQQHFVQGFGGEHNIDDFGLEIRYNEQEGLAIDLFADEPTYKNHVDELSKSTMKRVS